MSFTPGSGAIIILGVDGAAASQRDIESVADALRRLNDADFRRLNGQISGVQDHMGKLKSMVAGVFTAVVAGLSIAAFGNMVTGAIEAAGSMNDLAIQTGASAAALMQFKTIGATSDTTIEGIAGAMNKLAKGMAVSNEESEGLGQALIAIGVDFNALKRMAPEQQMLTVARAMDQFQDGTGKAAVAMTLYGKEGAKMLPFLKDLADEADNVTAALTSQEVEAKKALAAMADNFGDNLTKIKLASAESKKAISFGMLPALYEASEAFLKVTGEAGGLKETIARLSKDGTIAEWTRTGVTALTYLMDAFEIAGRVTQSVFKIMIGSLTVTGNTFAGLANAMVLFIRGEYAQSWEAMKETAAKNGAAVRGTVTGIADVFSDSTFGSKIRNSMAAIKGVGAAAAEAKKQVDYSAADDSTAKKSKEQSAYEALILSIREKVAAGQVEMSGYKQLSESQQLTIKLDELVRAGKIANVKANLDAARTLIAERAAQESVVESQKRAAAGAEAMTKIWKEYADAQAKSLEEATKSADQNEKLVATFGMTKGAIEGLELARLEEQLAQRASLGLTQDEIESLEKLIVAKKRSAAAAATLDGLEEQKKMWESIDKTAHDTFVSIFDSGKSAFDRLRDTLKNGLLDLLYQMTVKKWIFNIGASVGIGGSSGLAQAAGSLTGSSSAGGAGGLIGMAQTASSIYKAISGGFETLGTMVADTVQATMYGTGMTTQIASNGAFATGVGSAASGAAGALAGHYMGNAIAGDYSVSHGQTVTNVASVIGAVMGGPIGGAIGGAIGGLINRAFGMGSTEMKGQGISGSISSSGLTGSSYQNLHQDGGWFRSDKNWTDTKAFTGEMVSQFTQGFNAIKLASTGFASAIGASVESVASYSKTFNIALTNDAAANQKTVTDFFAGVGDEIALRLVPNLTDFSKTGETASTTLERLAGDFQATNQVAMLMGVSAKEMFGSLGIESTAARERLIELAGGVSTLSSQAATFAQNYLTEAERLAPVTEAVGAAMASLGLASVTTREQFKMVVQGLDVTTEAGAKQFAAMMALSESFAQVHPLTESTTTALRSQTDILNERADLQKQLDDLTMTSAQLLAQQRDALDESNRSLFDQVQAASAAKKAQDAAKASLGDVISRMTSFGDSARALRDGLLTGSLSDRTPEQQYAEARKQYELNLAAAKSGDERAQSRYEETVNTFLTASQKLFSGDAQYSADLAGVLATSDEMATWASDQVDLAQQSLDAMNEQVTGINNLNATMQSIAQTIGNLPGVAGPLPTFDTSPNYASMGRLDMAPLVAEIKALRDEVKAARIERQQQTGDVIERNDLVTRAAAEAVAAGMRDAAVDGAWVAGRPSKRSVS